MRAFGAWNIQTYLEAQQYFLAESVGGLGAEEILRVAPEKLAERQAELYTDWEIEIEREAARWARIDRAEIIANVEPLDRVRSSYLYELRLPFTGSANLARCQPKDLSPLEFTGLVCDVDGNKFISFRIEILGDAAESLKQEIEKRLDAAELFAGQVNKEARPELEKLQPLALQLIMNRRSELERLREVEATLSVPVLALEAPPERSPATREAVPAETGLHAWDSEQEPEAEAGAPAASAGSAGVGEREFGIFESEGDPDFHVTWNGKTFPIRRYRGLQYYSYVLERPLKLVGWIELANLGRAHTRDIKHDLVEDDETASGSDDSTYESIDADDSSLSLDDGLSVKGQLGERGDAADQRTILELRKAESKLLEQLARESTPSRRGLLERDLALVRKALKSQLARLGQPRRLGGPEERAARAIRKALGDARKQLAKKCPEFAAYLQQNVRLGQGPGILYAPAPVTYINPKP